MSDVGAATDVVEGLNATFLDRLPAAADRLTWPLEQMHRLRDERLRELLIHARDRSSWHRTRLAGLDLDSVSGDDLSRVPTMTKSDLMANWDTISCHPHVTLATAHEALERAAASGAVEFLTDDVVIVATGGSTGERGVIALDSSCLLEWVIANGRHGVWLREHGRQAPPKGPVAVQGRLTARSPTRITGAMAQIFQGSAMKIHSYPPTRPVAEIVAGLNELQPDHLFGYASMLHRMAHEARSGRLTISPTAISQSGEALLPEIRADVTEAFGIAVSNIYGATESFIAHSNGSDPWLHISEDIAVIEVVDDTNQPVEPGRRGTKLLVTNVVNKVLPLIRYELTDEVTLLPGPNPGPWTGRRIADPEGRRDDWFDYDGITVRPQAFRSPLSHVQVSEYQVHQTRTGADLTIVTSGHVDLDELSAHISRNLSELGLDQPEIHIRTAETIARHSATAKLRRFAPTPI